MTEIFKSEESKARIAEWHRVFRDGLPYPVESRTLKTSFGDTHLLVAGPENGKPLVALHGALASSAHLLPELGNLVEDRRVYAIDVIGQSVMSADRRLDLKDGSYSKWLKEVQDGLGLDCVDFLAVSWGGGVALNYAIDEPARVAKLVAVVPAGVAPGPALKGFLEAGWPIMRYLMKPTDGNLQKVTKGQFTTDDPQWRKFFGDALRNYKLDVRIPPIISDDRLKSISCPLLVFAAEFDLSFTGQKVIERIRELIPTAQTEMIAGSKHCPPFTKEHREWRAGVIRKFLD